MFQALFRWVTALMPRRRGADIPAGQSRQPVAAGSAQLELLPNPRAGESSLPPRSEINVEPLAPVLPASVPPVADLADRAERLCASLQQWELQVSRQVSRLERLDASARQAHLLADRARQRGDEDTAEAIGQHAAGFEAERARHTDGVAGAFAEYQDAVATAITAVSAAIQAEATDDLVVTLREITAARQRLTRRIIMISPEFSDEIGMSAVSNE